MSDIQDLKKAGFGDRPKKAPRRIIMAVDGREKQGKTTLALTAPDPIAFFDIDIGTEGVIEKFPNKNLAYKVMEIPKSQAEAKKLWEDFKKLYMAGLMKARTVVIDTATELRNLVLMAEWGKYKQLLPVQYTPAHDKMRELFREAYNHEANLILLHKRKKCYVGQKGKEIWNGEWERAGMADTGYLVQVNLVCERDGDGDFLVRCTDCRQNAEMAGEEYYHPMNTFPMIAGEVFPESDAEDWE